LKWWSGWVVGETGQALAACNAVEVGLDDGTGYVASDDCDDTVAPSCAALLPAHDPTFDGLEGESWYLGEHGRDLSDRNGSIGPIGWLDGQIDGGWTSG